MRWFGFGIVAVLTACSGEDSFVDDDDGDGFEEGVDDCDDKNAAIHAGATEMCDGVDNDCDGVIDGSNAEDGVAYYADVDGDTYGSEFSLVACDAPVGYTASPGDCDDANSEIHPGIEEVCDGLDNDCDGGADDDDPEGAEDESLWYLDADMDGFGVDTETVVACDAPAYYSALDGDCDDEEYRANPGEQEVCDDEGLDEDCDGLVNDLDDVFAGGVAWYLDFDQDGFGAGDPTMACELPAEHASLVDGDCDDLDGLISPDAVEVCDGAATDEDCNGVADDSDPGATGKTQWYLDLDEDGYGGASAGLSCSAGDGEVATSTDCDDSKGNIHPNAQEVCDPGDVDEDCDQLVDDADPTATGKSSWYEDEDEDGFGAGAARLGCAALAGEVASNTDCGPTEPWNYPGAEEICDGAPNDCGVSPWTAANEENVVSIAYEDWGGATQEVRITWSTDEQDPTFGTLEPGTYHVCAGPEAFQVHWVVDGEEVGIEGRAVGVYPAPVLTFASAEVLWVTGAGVATLGNLRFEGGIGYDNPNSGVTEGGAVWGSLAEIHGHSLTFADSTATHGGGIFVEDGSVLTLEDSLFDATDAAFGGGILARESEVTLTSVEMTDVSAQRGGGLWLWDSTLHCTGATISGSATELGGAIALFRSSAVCNDLTAATDGPFGSLFVDEFSDFQGTNVDFTGATGSASVYVGEYLVGVDYDHETGDLVCDGSSPNCNF